jgi:hypothetical protein
MTAVEWLVEQIIKEKGLVDLDIQAALEMEKQQIIDAHLAGQNSAEEVDGETEIEYYNETYKPST